MNEQPLQGGRVFEITDYTTASDWERFVASLEELLTDWKLCKETGFPFDSIPNGAISNGLWHEKHETLKFGKVSFDLRYQYLEVPNNAGKVDFVSTQKHHVELSHADKATIGHDATLPNQDEFHECDDGKSNLKQTERQHGEHELPRVMPPCLVDMVETSNDFASKAHCLVRWYNLRRFLILMPIGDTIISEDKTKLLLSSASIALANVDCHVPIFVQIHNPRSNFFQGISEHHNIRTMYDMVLIRNKMKNCEYLSELIGIFREKISCSITDPILATVRLNYCLSSFDLFVEPKDEFSGAEHSDDEEDGNIKDQPKRGSESKTMIAQDMRSGATFDQVREALDVCLPHPYRILRFLHVAAHWPPVSDKVITDSRVHSDLDPAEAPIWTIRCVTSDNCNMKIVHDTQTIFKLFKAAIDYAYDKLDADQVFTDCSRESLETTCLKLSYELATQPEVILSRNPSDSTRKILALMFYRSAELNEESDTLDQVSQRLKRKPSLSEIYREFRRNKPSVKEFIVRTQVARPFSPRTSPALPQRMFATVCDGEFRLCGAFSELCN